MSNKFFDTERFYDYEAFEFKPHLSGWARKHVAKFCRKVRKLAKVKEAREILKTELKECNES